MLSTIFARIGNISDIVAILGGLFSFLIWLKLRRQKKALMQIQVPISKKFDEMREHHSKINTINPYAFALSLLPPETSIKASVQDYLDSQKDPAWARMPIIELNYSTSIGPDNIKQFIRDLRQKKRELDLLHATEVHIFIKSQIMAAALIGAEFDNWRPVILYQQNHDTKKYEYWCALDMPHE